MIDSHGCSFSFIIILLFWKLYYMIDSHGCSFSLFLFYYFESYLEKWDIQLYSYDFFIWGC
jgi:hypothetical protein